MKRISVALFIIFVLALNVSGCVKRVSIRTIEKERIDQDISTGNKGYLAGNKPPAEEIGQKQTTRKIYQVTLEIPPYAEWKNFRNKKTEDKELWGNRGYIYGGPNTIAPKYDYEDAKEQKNVVLPDEDYEEKVVIPNKEIKNEPRVDEVKFVTYKVQKGDTLQKISSKVYGTTKRWQEIYNFNKGTLKNPNKIYPGQKILIPQN